MICLKQRVSVSNIDLSNQIIKSSKNSSDRLTLILDKEDSLDVLRKYGLDPENLYANYSEIIEGSDGDYFCSLFFKNNGYMTLIIPIQIAPATLTDTFYTTVQLEDIPDLGTEYMRVESLLTDTYNPEQFRLYIELESLKESALAGMQETFFRMGYKAAVDAIYNERKDKDENHI